jgi:hypothetical protein
VRSPGRCVVALLVLIACKRGGEPKPTPAATPAPPPPDAVLAVAAAAAPPSAPPDAAPRWYRAVARAPDGIEAPFYLGVAPRQVTFKIGSREVRDDATFDGKTLAAHLAIYQTAFDLAVQPDGTLAGTFSSSWRAQGATSLPLTATPVDSPALGTLGTVAGDAPRLDLGEPQTAWRLATSESGLAKMELHQVAPGELEGVLSFDNGNIVYVAGNARGDRAILTGFDDTSGYRLELLFDRHRKRAHAKWFAGAHFDWRETATATRGKDFALKLKLRPARAGAKVGLPALPELANLPAGPMLVELGGSWCSTCRNAAPFLHDLYREVQPRGLAFVTLLYELTDDAAADAQQAAHYKQTYGVTWPIVAVPGSTDDFAKIMPSGIAGLDPGNFPLLLFLSPDRRLVAFHAGFAAPGTDGYAAATAEIRASVEKLLASSKR